MGKATHEVFLVKEREAEKTLEGYLGNQRVMRLSVPLVAGVFGLTKQLLFILVELSNRQGVGVVGICKCDQKRCHFGEKLLVNFWVKRSQVRLQNLFRIDTWIFASLVLHRLVTVPSDAPEKSFETNIADFRQKFAIGTHGSFVQHSFASSTSVLGFVAHLFGLAIDFSLLAHLFGSTLLLNWRALDGRRSLQECVCCSCFILCDTNFIDLRLCNYLLKRCLGL